MDNASFYILLTRMRSRDQGAWTQFVQKCNPILYKQVAYQFPSLQQALFDEVVQETYLTFVRMMKQEFANHWAFQSYIACLLFLFGVARHRCVDLLKREHKTENLPSGIDFSDSSCGNPIVSIELDEMCSKVRAAIASLSSTDQYILTERSIRGRNYDEIAQELGLQEVAVRSRFSRAM